MRYIITIIWSVLIGAALSYVLSSMAGDAFNLTQSLVYAAGAFIIILLMDAVLGANTDTEH